MGNPASNKSIHTVFPTAFAHCMSVSHFGNSCNTSNFFTILFVMVTCGQCLQLTESTNDAYHFLAMKYILIKVRILFFRRNAIAHLTE